MFFIELTGTANNKILLNLSNIYMIEPNLATNGVYLDSVEYKESYEDVKKMIDWVSRNDFTLTSGGTIDD